MEPKDPDQKPIPQSTPRENDEQIDENRRAKELEEEPEEVVGPQPGGGEESGHS